jgi:hypothetical protein
MRIFALAVSLLAFAASAQAAEDWLNIQVGSEKEIWNLSEFPPSLIGAFIDLGRENTRNLRCDVYFPDPYAAVFRPKPKLHLVQIACPTDHLVLSQLFRFDGKKFIPMALPTGSPDAGFDLVFADLLNVHIDPKSGNAESGGKEFCDSLIPEDQNRSCDYSVVSYKLHNDIEYHPVEKRTFTSSGKLMRIDWFLGNGFNKSMLNVPAQ